MALTEKTILDAATWRPEFAAIEVRMAALILRDGAEISREYHRHVVGPDQLDLLTEHDHVQRIAMTFEAERTAAATKLHAAATTIAPQGKAR